MFIDLSDLYKALRPSGAKKYGSTMDPPGHCAPLERQTVVVPACSIGIWLLWSQNLIRRQQARSFPASTDPVLVRAFASLERRTS